MNIRAVAFDYGGVISLPPPRDEMNILASLAEISPELMERIYWTNRAAYDRGRISGKDYFKDMLVGAGVFPGADVLEKLVESDVQSWACINPETERLMDDVKKAGLKLGILSNMIQPFLDFARGTFPVLSLPDAAIYSCEVDTVKPEEAIYRLLLEAFHCAACELVFFDDVGANIEGAEKLGIRAILWKGPEAARRELEALRVFTG